MDENGNYTLVVEDWSEATGLFYNDSKVVVDIEVKDRDFHDKLYDLICEHYSDTNRYRAFSSTDWYPDDNEAWQNERL